jgi:hypothetical protein
MSDYRYRRDLHRLADVRRQEQRQDAALAVGAGIAIGLATGGIAVALLVSSAIGAAMCIGASLLALGVIAVDKWESR